MHDEVESDINVKREAYDSMVFHSAYTSKDVAPPQDPIDPIEMY